ncbi:MAG: nicotinate (nicotinamide) nucleotide adenylyltransferase [Thermoleophilia bacterium]|nr:nicotinate (nicotinamide) nucleotide adenylyltransferase [Thermoleophilia bacterium]
MNPPIGFAIVGGMFDPPHIGHVAVVEHASAWGSVLNPVVVVVGGVPPHREQPAASPNERLAMARAAFRNHAYVEVSDVEVVRAQSDPGRPSYTLDTVRELMPRFPGLTPYLVLGDDRAATLPSWHGFQELLALVEVLVVTRHVEGDVTETPALRAVRAVLPGKLVHWCPMSPVEASSSEVRELLAQGRIEKAHAMVPPTVRSLLDATYLAAQA